MLIWSAHLPGYMLIYLVTRSGVTMFSVRFGSMGRRLFQKFVRAGCDGRHWNKRHRFLTPIVAKVHQSGPWGWAVDGQPWRAAGADFWNKRHGFLAPIVAEVRQSGPWTAGRDGPPGGTFETNGTDSWRRLLQNSVRAGRGRPAVAGRQNGLLKQTARIPAADCCRSSSERAVDGRPWRAAGRDFWNKRHGILAPIVAEVRQSEPWEPAVDWRPWRAAGMDFWNKWDGFLVPIVSKVSQSGPWTAGRDRPLGWTFETNGADSLRRLLQKSIRAGRGVGPWTAGRDGPPGWTFETNGTDSWRRLLQKFVRAGRGSRPWTDGRDGLLRWTFETNGTDSWRWLFQKSVRSGRAC